MVADYIPKQIAQVKVYQIKNPCNGEVTYKTFLNLEQEDVEGLGFWNNVLRSWVPYDEFKKDEIRKRLFERDHPNHKQELAFATTPEQVVGTMNRPEEDILTPDEVKEIFGCKKCGGMKVIIDPPLEQQEEEAKAGKRTWLTHRPCPVCMETPKREMTLNIIDEAMVDDGEELQLPEPDTTSPEESWRDRPPML